MENVVDTTASAQIDVSSYDQQPTFLKKMVGAEAITGRINHILELAGSDDRYEPGQVDTYIDQQQQLVDAEDPASLTFETDKLVQAVANRYINRAIDEKNGKDPDKTVEEEDQYIAANLEDVKRGFYT